jgi:hypothetical protein
MNCPWGCGWEGEPKDYVAHLEACPNITSFGRKIVGFVRGSPLHQSGETRTITLANRTVVVAYEEDPKLSRESGWYIVRDYDPKTLEWVDHARPGFGETLWITPENAKKYGLTSNPGPGTSFKEVPMLYKGTLDEINEAISKEKDVIDDYAELENKLRTHGLDAEGDIVHEIRDDEIDHKRKFEAILQSYH